MSKPLTPTQRIAWDAIGHDQTHWTAVLAALRAVGPHHRDTVARNIASILDDYEMTEAAELVRNLPAMEAAITAETTMPDAFTVEYPASPTESPEPAEPSTPDDPPTPDAIEAATAWLLRDHDERVTTGTVRPARERAAGLVAQIRPVIYREAAARLHAICGQAGHGGDCPLICERGGDVLILEDWAAEMETTVDRGEATC